VNVSYLSPSSACGNRTRVRTCLPYILYIFDMCHPVVRDKFLRLRKNLQLPSVVPEMGREIQVR
jgi:hypothetical protein